MSRKYVAVPSIEGGAVSYRVNYVDQQRGFLPEDSIGDGMSLEEARELARQLNERATGLYPPTPPPTKQSTWWSK